MKTGKHTALPWSKANNVGYVFGDNCVVATCGDFRDKELVPFNAERWNADADLIVDAVNAYEFLLAENAKLKTALKSIVSARHGHAANCGCPWCLARQAAYSQPESA